MWLSLLGCRVNHFKGNIALKPVLQYAATHSKILCVLDLTHLTLSIGQFQIHQVLRQFRAGKPIKDHYSKLLWANQEAPSARKWSFFIEDHCRICMCCRYIEGKDLWVSTGSFFNQIYNRIIKCRVLKSDPIINISYKEILNNIQQATREK